MEIKSRGWAGRGGHLGAGDPTPVSALLDVPVDSAMSRFAPPPSSTSTPQDRQLQAIISDYVGELADPAICRLLSAASSIPILRLAPRP